MSQEVNCHQKSDLFLPHIEKQAFLVGSEKKKNKIGSNGFSMHVQYRFLNPFLRTDVSYLYYLSMLP